jgi:hypothetical protein
MAEIGKIGYSKSSKWEYRDNKFLNNNSIGPGRERFPKKTNKGESLMRSLETDLHHREENHE